MRGITFGDKHTYNDYGLYLSARPVVSSPKVKTNLVDIPGGNGSIDMSEVLTGHPVYETRMLSATFVVINARDRWTEVITQLLNDLHGKRMQIRLDDDPLYYWTGRVSVSEMKTEKKTAYITIEAIVDPYKHSTTGSEVML